MKTSVATFVEALLESRVLDPAQVGEFSREGLADSGDLGALTEDLLRRGWLTRYQLAELEGGRGQGLVRGQYLLLEGLGEGGMGRVFKARHRRMRRVVALKLIHQHMLVDPLAVQRFYREIEAVARLSHPNIVMAFDADEVDGDHFLVTEYVEGVDLRTLLARDGPLPMARACEAARQAALGLQHAHSLGLVHRDIKPANLLLSREGVVKILDLGLARLAAPELGEPGAGRLTRTGEVMGTPDYVAPEQIHDFHRVDIRADIYGLGCTLYHLLAGASPFAGRSLAEKLLAHRQGEPPDLAALRSDLPPGLAAVVRVMMAVRPEHRYQTPAEVASALEPFSRSSDAGQLAAPQAPRPETGRNREGEGSGPSEPPERHETLAPRPGSSRPAVDPEPQPTALSHRPPTWRQAGGLRRRRALVAAPLPRPPTWRRTGGFRKRRALVAAALVLAPIGLLAWRPWASRGTGQGTSIVQGMPVSKPRAEPAHVASPRGASGRLVTEGEAVRSDPGLARDYLNRARADVDARDSARAIADACEAIRLDPTLAEAYTLRATAYNMSGQLPQAIADATEALRLDPGSSPAYAQRALAYNNVGEHDRAIADATEALRLDPGSSLAYTQRAWAYLMAKGDPDRAIADYTEALRLDPKAAWVYEHRARAYIKKGEPDRVIADCTEALRFDPNLAFASFERGEAYARKGDSTRALADADEAIRLEPQLAAAHRLRGDIRAAAGALDRALADYDEAIRLDPKDAVAYHKRGLVRYEKKEYDRAVADHGEAIRLDPNYALAFTKRGRAYAALGDFDRAIADQDEAIRLDPKDPWAHHNRGLARYDKKQLDWAIADYSEAIRLDPRLVWAYYNRGHAYRAKGDFDRAIADYDEVIRLDPNREDARRDRAIARSKRQQAR